MSTGGRRAPNGLILYLVFSPAMLAHMQSGLNAVWEKEGSAV